MLELNTITRALALPENASDRDILDRIADLRDEAGEEEVDDLSDRELIRRGEHEHVSITETGATVTLYVPLQSGTETVTELKVRRPTARHLKRMAEAKGGNVGGAITMLADLTGRAPSEIEGMDAADFVLCSAVLYFLQRPPRKTGSKS